MIKEILLTGFIRRSLFSKITGTIVEWLIGNGWLKPGEAPTIKTFLDLFVAGMWDLEHPKAQPPNKR